MSAEVRTVSMPLVEAHQLVEESDRSTLPVSVGKDQVDHRANSYNHESELIKNQVASDKVRVRISSGAGECAHF